jgi:hypothetical protein
MKPKRIRLPKPARRALATAANAVLPPKDYEFDGSLATECWSCGRERPDDLEPCPHCKAECTPF